MANRRAERQQKAADFLTKFCSKQDRWLMNAAEIAQWLNGMGFVTRNAGVLISADRVARWARQGRLPARAGAGHRRGVQTSILLLLAWLCGPQKCVSTPREARKMWLPRAAQPARSVKSGPPMRSAAADTHADPTDPTQLDR